MRTRFLLGLSAILLLFVADPCLAASGGGGDRDMFERALDLGVWTLVVFLLLIVILGKYAWKPILEGLDQRERAIAAAVEDAKKVKEEAAELRRQLAEDRQKANDEARDIREKAHKAAETTLAEGRAAGLAEIQAERERLLRELTVAKDQAIKEMWTQSAQLASAISSKAIRRNLSAEDHRGLVDEALADMNEAVESRRRSFGTGEVA